ncbi:flagellar basal body-associated FliL family protein [Pelagibacterium halotolerans]|uniref:Flagellar protein FliL n=1 Tax=Pelagibacterium halotolerans (strain DSM 22347 / JCM 15775 / CGMCC 1.7692 / B2) TaxID=1082931 RepID=G4REA8_PELHB|nr:flagellar basal body-associated FliL family protein [Pelagibacterium halotolerans]AEQ51872.1 flagellar biosynthesis protein FliL [Pelagibacterium halotolerans B2]QJR18323.1 flagellar basal body-associated protein FliL [Pelagibacterium halotolerans]SEA25660.1 flagellar FliL protein [Pelagibacterium halotolerans]
MTDVTETEINATSEAAPAKKGLPKMALIGGGVAVLLLVAGAGGWFLTQSGGGDAGHDGEIEVAAETAFYDLPDITVNLSNPGGAAEFLRMRIALEVRDETMIEVIEPRLPRVLDAFQVYLRELRRSDIEGSAGIYRLKEELLRRVNLAVYPASVDNILFKDILVQ